MYIILERQLEKELHQLRKVLTKVIKRAAALGVENIHSTSTRTSNSNSNSTTATTSTQQHHPLDIQQIQTLKEGYDALLQEKQRLEEYVSYYNLYIYIYLLFFNNFLYYLFLYIFIKYILKYYFLYILLCYIYYIKLCKYIIIYIL